MSIIPFSSVSAEQTALGRRSRLLFRVVTAFALVCTVFVVGLSGIASATPSFPNKFPPNENQLPALPKEPKIYDALPVTPPDKDRWYRDPANLAELKPGSIIRSRVIQTRLLGIPVPVFAKQLLFRSTDVHGKPIATATTVVIPGIPWKGSPRPVVSYQEAIDSLDSSCNPSFTLRAGTFKEIALLQYFVYQGFAINIPDFDGKYNTFATADEGYMVLDSLRAMKNDRSLNLKHSAIGLYGYSGGGIGSAHAAELRASYAPDVKITSAAFGGLPADYSKLADYSSKPQPGLTGASNFMMWLGFAGFGKQYPEAFDPKRVLTRKGQGIVANLKDRCLYTAVGTGMFRPIESYLKPGFDLSEDRKIQKVLKDNSLGQHIPDFPILWYHGMWDELNWQSRTVLPVVNKYWSQGADMRYVTLPSVEHITNQMTAWIPSTAWMSATLRGIDPGPRFKLDYPAPLPPGFPGT